MKKILNRVTITGADDSIRPEELIAVSRRFPWVEWGILFSDSNQGNFVDGGRDAVPRYPTLAWLKELMDLNPQIHLSAHLCGKYVKDVCGGNWSWMEKNPGVESLFGRIQLNFADMSVNHVEQMRTALADMRIAGKQIIFGCKNAVHTIRQNFMDMNVAPLFDASGGKGLLGEWPVHPGFYCGYAGGLAPDNLREQLGILSNVVGGNIVWIDVESKVRSPDDAIFDMKKVERFLKIAEDWIS